MRAKTVELLYLLLWTYEMFGRPSISHVGESFEGWAYRRGFHQQLRRLERRKFLECQQNPAGEARVYRLTEIGRRAALGGSDPEEEWKRDWDGEWRTVVFDIPQIRATDRARLRRSLRRQKFGYLQDSVWITPDPLKEVLEQLRGAKIDVESLMLLRSKPCGGESDDDIVQGAWNFAAINEAYETHEQILSQRPSLKMSAKNTANRWRTWFFDERRAWQKIVALDPFLPRELHPRGYRGMTAWRRRLNTMRDASRYLQQFKSPE